MPSAVIYQVMTQMQTQIRALSLTGIASADVLIKWCPRQLDNTTDPTPCIEICPAPLPEGMDQQDLTATDKVRYPVLVTIIDANNQDFDKDLDRNLLWREKINREFRYRPLTGISEIIHCFPEPKAIIDPAWFRLNRFYSAIVFRFVSRETRGN